MHRALDGRTALHLACQYGQGNTVAALLLNGSNVHSLDFAGRSPLQLASAEGHVEIVQQLLRHGARVDHQDEVLGNTALHEAAWKGYSQTLEALCKAKANVFMKNKGGFAAIHLACQNGHNQSCRVLLLAGCKPDIKNNYGDAPIHTAARYGHAGVMRILISALCKVSEPNKNMDTALHIAVAMGRRKLTRILLETKCNTSIQNKQGETVMDIAKRKKFDEIQAILLNPPAERIPVHSTTDKTQKKREKDSGTSSKESGKKHADKHKKSKRNHKVHFMPTENPKSSPYGCHFSPGPSIVPRPKLDTLPKEPLGKGEQYYLDLSGNILKGPVGRGYACYCAPFFRQVENKLEGNKQELIQHIDSAKADLQHRMTHFEKRTKGRIVNLGQMVQEKMANERVEGQERAAKMALTERYALEETQNKGLNHVRRELHCMIQEKMKQFEEKHGFCYNPRHRSFIVGRERTKLKKSKSEEMLSEINNTFLDSDRNAKPIKLRKHTSTPFLESVLYQGSQDSGYNAVNAANATQTSDLLIVESEPHSSQEFNITEPFFDTITNEMEKWYERRLVSLEKKAEEKLLVNKEEIQDRIRAIEDQLTKLNEINECPVDRTSDCNLRIPKTGMRNRFQI
uniref:Uncharacterized protein n=1 Tax=Strigamia maritima TaxID=126957 RepID=T1IQZ0_STRMM